MSSRVCSPAITLVFVCLLAAVSANASAQTVQFDPAKAAYQSGAAPVNLTAGDFDGDGRLDLASADPVKQVVRIFYGQGNGLFDIGPNVFFNDGPVGLAAGDINGDGRIDLVVGTTQLGGSIVALLSNGDRSFRRVATASGQWTRFLTLADLNGDGRLDIVGVGAANAFVMLNTGAGSFSAAANTGVSATAVATGDLNHDGLVDLVAPDSRAGKFTVAFGRGDGTFGRALAYATASQPNHAAIADMNQDGVMDVLISEYLGSRSGGAVAFYQGRGDGTLLAPQSVATNAAANRLSVADFNGDGVLDVAAGGGIGAMVLIGGAEGSLMPPAYFSTNGGPAETSGDFNNDGRIDLAALGGGATVTTVILNSTPRSSLGNSQQVVWTNLTNTNAAGSTLRKTSGCDGCFDASGFSTQRISGNTDSAVDFTVSETAGLRALGLTRAAAGTTPDILDFSIRVQGGYAEAREGGVYRWDVPVVPGDVLRIAIQSRVVRYLKNGQVFYVSALAPSYPLAIAGVMATIDSTLSNVAVYGAGTSSGGGGGAGGGTGSAEWTQSSNVAVNGSSVQKTDGCDGCFDASALSAQSIAAGGAGFMEFTVNDPNPLLVAGLASAFTGADPTTIDFGIRLQSGYAEVRENGIYCTDVRIDAGDIIRIAVSAEGVSYSVNGVVFYVSSNAPAGDLFAAVAIAAIGGGIDQVTIGSGA